MKSISISTKKEYFVGADIAHTYSLYHVAIPTDVELLSQAGLQRMFLGHPAIFLMVKVFCTLRLQTVYSLHLAIFIGL